MNTPLCSICGQYEVGTFADLDIYCSVNCQWAAEDGVVEPEEFDEDGDASWYGLTDDADALASAGWGTDEDYGDYGGDEW